MLLLKDLGEQQKNHISYPQAVTGQAQAQLLVPLDPLET